MDAMDLNQNVVILDRRSGIQFCVKFFSGSPIAASRPGRERVLGTPGNDNVLGSVMNIDNIDIRG